MLHCAATIFALVCIGTDVNNTGFFPQPVNTDGTNTSEQSYIDALRAYTNQQAAAVTRPAAPNLQLRPASAMVSPSGAATTPIAAALPFSFGQWHPPDDLIGLGLDGADARADVRSAGAGHRVNNSVGGNGESAGHVHDANHTFTYINGLSNSHGAA